MKVIRINTDATIRRETISEDTFCVVIDNFLQDPRALVEFAAQHADSFSVPESKYPGVLLRIDQDAMTEIYRFIRTKMTKQFPFPRGDMKMWTNFSMATLRPDELSTFQRLCHTDPLAGRGRKTYAALVYLFENEDLGGTGFYRWKELESMQKAFAIESEDPDKAMAFLRERFPTYREPARYMNESSEIAEHLRTIPARFNRMIFYSGTEPHSAAITAPELLSKDFRNGRLTLNDFADVLPR